MISLYTAAECPDLFYLPLDGDPSQGKWVLWGSTDTYLVGRFEGRRFVPETESIPGPIHQLYSAYSDFVHSPGGYAAKPLPGCRKAEWYSFPGFAPGWSMDPFPAASACRTSWDW